MSPQVPFRFEREQLARLDAIARARGWSRSELIRFILDQAIPQFERNASPVTQRIDPGGTRA
jgi:hypothetical protein